MIHLLPLALAKAKWKIPGFEESSSESIVAERIVSTIPYADDFVIPSVCPYVRCAG